MLEGIAPIGFHEVMIKVGRGDPHLHAISIFP
jgi:hypothetical protein